MTAPACSSKRTASALSVALLCVLSTQLGVQGLASVEESTPIEAEHQRLKAGEVVVDAKDINGTKYVVARIIIDENPQKLWTVLANPFEFRGRICHRMKKVDVLTDQPLFSVMDCKIGVVFPIPDINYVVESKYVNCKRIDFKRISGSLRDFKGFWELQPLEGNKTEVTYSMYVDPGFPVPDWIVRQGVRNELPNVLTGLRERVHSLKYDHGIPEKHTIAAAHTPHTL